MAAEGPCRLGAYASATPSERGDAEVGRASRSKGDGLHVLDVGVFAELLAPSRLCATCPGVGADRLDERAVVGAALLVSRQAAKPRRGLRVGRRSPRRTGGLCVPLLGQRSACPYRLSRMVLYPGDSEDVLEG